MILIWFNYGYGRPVKTEKLKTLQVELRSDGLVKEISVWRWTFPDKTLTCIVWQSYRRCKTGGQEFTDIKGRWTWTGERYSEPYEGAA